MPFVRNEKELLKSKLNEMSHKYKVLGSQLDILISQNKSLRVAANLPSLSEEERRIGTGGSSKENYFDIIKYKNNNELIKTLSLVDDIERRINFEVDNYRKIKNSLDRNQKLFSSIPAIKPCEGELAAHGFGMRFHPILKISRMHNGIDIITDLGTAVYSPGAGVVDFVGHKGGLGLTVEIDHGFGYRTVFGHLSDTFVKVGQKINRSYRIASTGNSGLSSGPHLHYEVIYYGVNLNPEDFFFNDTDLFKPVN